METINNIQVVFFDFGDTLLFFDGDWEEIQNQSMNTLWQYLAGYGFQMQKATFEKEFSSRMASYYQSREQNYQELTTAYILAQTLHSFGFDNLEETILHKALQAMYKISEQQWKLDPQAKDLLNWLSHEGYHIGLISNASDSEDVFTLLKQHDLINFFEVVLISAEKGLRKPHPAMFLEGIQYFNVKAQQCVMVGDKLNMDIQGAKQTGMHTIWFARCEEENQLPITDNNRPDYIITQLSEIKKYLAAKPCESQ